MSRTLNTHKKGNSTPHLQGIQGIDYAVKQKM